MASIKNAAFKHMQSTSQEPIQDWKVCSVCCSKTKRSTQLAYFAFREDRLWLKHNVKIEVQKCKV